MKKVTAIFMGCLVVRPRELRVRRNYRSWYELKAPRKGLRIHYTHSEPFVFCEFCKSMHTHGNVPHVHPIKSLSRFRGPPEGVRCAGGCYIKCTSDHHAWVVSSCTYVHCVYTHVAYISCSNVHYCTRDRVEILYTRVHSHDTCTIHSCTYALLKLWTYHALMKQLY